MTFYGKIQFLYIPNCNVAFMIQGLIKSFYSIEHRNSVLDAPCFPLMLLKNEFFLHSEALGNNNDRLRTYGGFIIGFICKESIMPSF